MRFLPVICLSALWLATLPLGAQEASVEGTNSSSASRKAQSPPLPPPSPSPVAIFRELLAKTPSERLSSLSNRPPESRQRILAKLQEYQRMNADERELRLRATELRWFLTPLLSLPSTNRAGRLAQVPEDLRPLVESRLAHWNVLPPGLQQQVLEEDRNLQLYLQLAGSSVEERQRILNRLPADQRVAAEAGFDRWQKLTTTEREQAMQRVSRYFDLKPAEKQQVLARLSDAERRQMESSLQAFERLPRDKRARCLDAFPKFANLTAGERAEFLANVSRWQAMSPSERELFRRLVQQAPALPPLPRPALPRPTTASTNRG